MIFRGGTGGALGSGCCSPPALSTVRLTGLVCLALRERFPEVTTRNEIYLSCWAGSRSPSPLSAGARAFGRAADGRKGIFAPPCTALASEGLRWVASPSVTGPVTSGRPSSYGLWGQFLRECFLEAQTLLSGKITSQMSSLPQLPSQPRLSLCFLQMSLPL